jgi:hypothetical protein
MTSFHMTAVLRADLRRASAAAIGSIGRIWLAAAIVALVGGGPALAQGMSTPRTPAAGAGSAPAAVGAPLGGGAGGSALGTIPLTLGGLGQMQAGAMGSIATCPASETAGVLPPITGTPTTIPFVPLVTSPFAPTLPSMFGTPALTQFGTLSIPPIGTPTTPAFGTSAMSGICSPTAPAQPAPLGIPASLAPGIGAAFSDAAIPLEATEASGGVGLSPLISVPPPAISSSGCAGTPTMMGAAPLAMPSSSASGASPC